MYLWTILGAGGFGLSFLLIPSTMGAIFGWPNQDPVLFGVSGSVYVAFALLSILGFRSPLKFVPVLMLQLCYKSIWFIVVVLPNFVMGRMYMYGWVMAVIFATYVIGDLIAIPFSYVFEKEMK